VCGQFIVHVLASINYSDVRDAPPNLPTL